MNNYPNHVNDVICEMEYPPAVLQALYNYRDSRPWRGTLRERQTKLRKLHRELNAVTGRKTRLKIQGVSIPDRYQISADCIYLNSEFSVITYLHEYAHALFGRDEVTACRWSINLFRKVFPRSYSRLEVVGHTLRRQSNV